MRLTHRDFDSLQRTILELNAFHSLESFQRVAPESLLRLLRGDYVTLMGFSVDPETRRAAMIGYAETTPVIAADPLVRVQALGPEPSPASRREAGTVHAFADIFVNRQFRDSAILMTLLRQNFGLLLGGIDDNPSRRPTIRASNGSARPSYPDSPSGRPRCLVGPFTGRGPEQPAAMERPAVRLVSIDRDYAARVLGLNEQRWWFYVSRTHGTKTGTLWTRRDRLLLRLLKPHLEQAFHNAQLRTLRSTEGCRPMEDFGLTTREAEIARWIAMGKTNLEIAMILDMKPRTVEKHVENILRKLAVENRTAAALTIARAI